MPDQSFQASLADLICEHLNAGMSARDIAAEMARTEDRLIDHAATQELQDRIEFKDAMG